MDLDQFLREASDAMDDQEKLTQFVRAKVTFAIERFLNYLPRMSIREFIRTLTCIFSFCTTFHCASHFAVPKLYSILSRGKA